MNKLFSAFLIALAFFACGPLPQDQEAESAVGITAPDGYAVTCASGYVRIAPHNCKGLSFVETVVFTVNGACNTVTLSTVPSSALGVYGTLITVWQSANAIANRSVQTDFFTTAGCTGQTFTATQVQREWVALAATNMGQTLLGQITFRKSSGTTNFYAINTAIACTGCTQSLAVEGYYD